MEMNDGWPEGCNKDVQGYGNPDVPRSNGYQKVAKSG